MTVGEEINGRELAGQGASPDPLFDSFLENTPNVAIQGFDRYGVVRHWNRACRDMYGIGADEAMGRRLQELILSGATVLEFEETLFRVWQSGTACEPREWPVHTKSGEERWVYSSMFPVLNGGVVTEVFCMDVDITDRKRAEHRALESEEIALALLNAASESAFLVKRDGTIIALNEPAASFFGRTPSEIVGSSILQWFQPEAAASIRAKIEEVVSYPVPVRFEVQRGSSRLLHNVCPIVTSEGIVERLAVYVRDVTETEKAGENVARINRLYSVLSKTNEAIVRIRNPRELYEQVCRIAVEDGLLRMAWIGLLDQETHLVNPVAQWGFDEGYLDSIRVSVLEIPEGIGPTGTSVREGRPVVCDDIEHDQRFHYGDEALKRGFRSNAAFPLTVGSRTIGALTLYATEPRFFDEEQLRLLGALAGDISFAIESMEMEERRKEAEQALRRSEEHYRGLIENTSDILTIINPDGSFRYISPSVERVLGYKRSELWGKKLTDYVHPEDLENVIMNQADAIANPGIARHVLARVMHKNGSWRTLETIGKGLLGEGTEAGIIINARDITERDLADARLRESEEVSRALINATDDTTVLIAEDGTLLAINDAGARRLGKSPEDVVGTNFLDLFPREVADVRRAHGEEVLKTGVPLRYEDSRNGIMFDNTIYPVQDAGGRISRLAIIARDVTEIKKSEEAQKKDRDFISAVLDTTGALVVVLDAEGRIILFNKTCEETTGYTVDEVRGLPMWRLFVMPEELNDTRAVFDRLIEGEASAEIESHWVTKDGIHRLISWSSSSLVGGGGKVEYVISTGIDITERKKAEMGLKASEERYRSIFESTRTAMCIVESDTSVSFVNKEFERMTGCEADDSTHANRRFTEFMVAEDTWAFTEYHNQVLSGGQDAPVYFECRILERSGHTLYVLASIGLIPGTESSVVSLIDITREKDYESDLKEKADRLRHFLTVASHELRHPITVIKGYSNTLVEYMEKMPKEMILEILDDIENSTGRLTHLVEELMDVSRIEEGRTPLERQQVDAELLTHMALEDMRVVGCMNEITVRIAEDMPPLQVDSDKLVQVLTLLLENAVKFGPEMSPIEVTASASGEAVLFSVLDRGPGVPEEDADKIFDRFYQVTDALHHSIPGIGLGLYIAREIINAHGGRIWCESREGGGSTFRFEVPIS